MAANRASLAPTRKLSDRFFQIFIPSCAFIGGMAVNAFTIAEQIATKPYVDVRFKESKLYTDERTSATLQSAIEHSDMNRQLMVTSMAGYASDMKNQGSRIDMIFDEIKELRKEAFTPHRQGR